MDIATLEMSVHADRTALKASVTMRVNELRSALCDEMGAFKSAVDRRFDAADKRFDGMDQRFDGLAGQLADCMREMRSERS